MRFFTRDESVAWAKGLGLELNEQFGTPDREPEHLHHVRFLLPQTPGQVAWLSRFISGCLMPRANCLLWVSDRLFLDYEEADLISFLELGILNGWDMHLLPVLNYGGTDTARAFVSHDEWVVLSHREPNRVNEWTETLRRAEYRVPSPGAA